jgi:alpha-glucosidase
MMLPGMPVMYYGDEIGMEDAVIPPELTKDKFERTGDSGGRDPERTPMQWDDSPLAGFTNVTPWLPIGQNSAKKNVVSELHDPDSWLSLYRALLELRKDPVLQRGTFKVVACDSGYVLAFERSVDGTVYYAVFNFANAMQIITLPVRAKELRVSTHLGGVTIRDDGRVVLPGFAAALLTGEAAQGSS